MVVKLWCVVVGAGVIGALLLSGTFGNGAHLLKTVAKPVDVKVSVARLLDDCGYDLDDFTVLREPSARCIRYVRERIHLESTLRNVAAMDERNRYSQVCVAELLDLPDDELVAVVAGWMSRQRYLLYGRLADPSIKVALQKNYRCHPRPRARGWALGQRAKIR